MSSPRKTGLEALVELTCANWCLGSSNSADETTRTVFDMLPSTGSITAEQFALAAFEVSGVDPDSEPMWKRAKQEIIEGFRECLGRNEVDASELLWRFENGAPRNLPLPDPEAFRRGMTDTELQAQIAEYPNSREAVLCRRELDHRHGIWLRLKQFLGHRSPR
jgi:hypothetical protein